MLTAAAVLHGCSSTSGDELCYRTTIEYFNEGYKYTASSVNSMTAIRYYDYNLQNNGWNLSCNLSAYAIPLKLREVTVFALLDRHSGEKAGYGQCSIVYGTFWLYEQMHQSDWLAIWNKLAKSQSKEFIQQGFYPRFMVVDRGGDLGSGRIVKSEDLRNYGMEIHEMSISITRDELTKIPREIVDIGCEPTTKLNKYTTEQPKCNSLIARNDDRQN